MNELVLVEKIEKRLQQPQEVKVFPLTPTHRKELRELRDANIGQLKQRLRTIRELKKEEYINKYHKDIKLEHEKYEKIATRLNKDWKRIVDSIKAMIDKRIKLEESLKIYTKSINLYNNYGSLPNLNVKNDVWKREFSTNMNDLIKKIATEEFDKKYGSSFQSSQDFIDKLYTMYEEAINFGDLEIVKDIYYKLKDADKFFEKVANIKI